MQTGFISGWEARKSGQYCLGVVLLIAAGFMAATGVGWRPTGDLSRHNTAGDESTSTSTEAAETSLAVPVVVAMHWCGDGRGRDGSWECSYSSMAAQFAADRKAAFYAERSVI